MCKCQFLPLRYVCIYIHILCLYIFQISKEHPPGYHPFAIVQLWSSQVLETHVLEGTAPTVLLPALKTFSLPEIWVYQGFLELQDHAQNSTSPAIRLLTTCHAFCTGWMSFDGAGLAIC